MSPPESSHGAANSPVGTGDTLSGGRGLKPDVQMKDTASASAPLIGWCLAPRGRYSHLQIVSSKAVFGWRSPETRTAEGRGRFPIAPLLKSLCEQILKYRGWVMLFYLHDSAPLGSSRYFYDGVRLRMPLLAGRRNNTQTRHF